MRRFCCMLPIDAADQGWRALKGASGTKPGGTRLPPRDWPANYSRVAAPFDLIARIAAAVLVSTPSFS